MFATDSCLCFGVLEGNTFFFFFFLNSKEVLLKGVENDLMRSASSRTGIRCQLLTHDDVLKYKGLFFCFLH